MLTNVGAESLLRCHCSEYAAIHVEPQFVSLEYKLFPAMHFRLAHHHHLLRNHGQILGLRLKEICNLNQSIDVWME